MSRPITPRAVAILGVTAGTLMIALATAAAIRSWWMAALIALILLGGIAWAARADRDPLPAAPDQCREAARQTPAWSAASWSCSCCGMPPPNSAPARGRPGMAVYPPTTRDLLKDEARAKRYHDGLGDES